MREPREYSGDRSSYKEWRGSQHTYVTAHGPLLVQVMLALEQEQVSTWTMTVLTAMNMTKFRFLRYSMYLLIS